MSAEQDEKMEAAIIAAYRECLTAAGWQIVPMSPTDEMLAACLRKFYGMAVREDVIVEIWRRMLAGANSPPLGALP